MCLHINAKYVGVAQNRPRFLLLGVREDIFSKLKPNLNDFEKKLFEQPNNFYRAVKNSEEVTLNALSYRDVADENDFLLLKETFLNYLVSKTTFISVKDAINDLLKVQKKKSDFVNNLNTTFAAVLPKQKMSNHELRNNGDLVRRRFRIYQVLEEIGKETSNNILLILKGSEEEIKDEVWEKVSQFDFLMKSGVLAKFQSKASFISYLKEHTTKKQTQRALSANNPAPAALSIPDDACHYAKEELRTLTVREMARIQSFPDNFVFRSKVTTGGKMRRFEVPQYTQVGNAVPPLLGHAIGQAITDLLKRIDD